MSHYKVYSLYNGVNTVYLCVNGNNDGSYMWHPNKSLAAQFETADAAHRAIGAWVQFECKRHNCDGNKLPRLVEAIYQSARITGCEGDVSYW